MRIFVLTGAGISAESGIPTFRGKEGYWRNLDPTKLATPSAFDENPKLVWEWYRERRQRIRDAQPNAAHEAIVRLAQQSGDFLLVTQNVDDLHARARWNATRLPRDKIVQIHGDIFVTRCSHCDFALDEEGKEEEEISRCWRCGKWMRPGVVWFGEQLDARKIMRVEDFLAHEDCDFAIVIGTTATFGYIIDWALRARGQKGRLIEVNPDETALSPLATQVIREPAATALPRLVDQLVAIPL
jgi:NAD-dependent protein deacetylase/lipoamidase